MGKFDAFGEAERAGWTNQETARRYVAQFAEAADQAMKGMIAAVAPKRESAVLDLCCGHGAMSLALCERGCTVTGLDFSDAMLAFAKERAPDALFQQGDAQDLPFADASFDTVLCNLGIMHLPDQPRALGEVRRVLRPGGTCAMTVWCGPDKSPSFRIAMHAIASHADASVSPPPQPDFFQFADSEAARALLIEAGLELLSHSNIDCVWNLATADQLFEIYSESTVRMAMVLSAQPAAARQAIREAMREAVERNHATGNGYQVAIPAALIVARS